MVHPTGVGLSGAVISPRIWTRTVSHRIWHASRFIVSRDSAESYTAILGLLVILCIHKYQTSIVFNLIEIQVIGTCDGSPKKEQNIRKSIVLRIGPGYLCALNYRHITTMYLSGSVRCAKRR